MYVLIVFNRFDESSIDAVLGPFDDIKESHDKYYELFGDSYRRVSHQQVVGKLPDWATL